MRFFFHVVDSSLLIYNYLKKKEEKAPFSAPTAEPPPSFSNLNIRHVYELTHTTHDRHFLLTQTQQRLLLSEAPPSFLATREEMRSQVECPTIRSITRMHVPNDDGGDLDLEEETKFQYTRRTSLLDDDGLTHSIENAGHPASTTQTTTRTTTRVVATATSRCFPHETRHSTRPPSQQIARVDRDGA